eukprot:2726015-Alexandrium_andersonii.AAC.1
MVLNRTRARHPEQSATKEPRSLVLGCTARRGAGARRGAAPGASAGASAVAGDAAAPAEADAKARERVS